MYRVWLLFILSVFAGGCHHNHKRCDTCDRGSSDKPLAPPRSDPGIMRDPVVPPNVIQPRGDPLPTTPGPTSRYYPPETGSGPKLETPIGAPPASIPSEPLPQRSNRELLLPDGGSDPLLKSQSNFVPETKFDPTRPAFLEPIISGRASDLPPDDDDAPLPSTRIMLPPEAVKPTQTDLPDLSTSKKPLSVSEFEYVPGLTNVATGRKPLSEGLNRLKSQGFKTVAYLHEPKADLSATKSLIENAGLKFVAVEVSPQTLKDSLATFAELVRNTDARPLYISDDDGVRAGSLWYLYFRKYELLDNDQARLRAGRLGLKDASTSEQQKQFWIAINAFLAK